jgi:hypothetical protein
MKIIAAGKTKTKAFKRRDVVRSEIILNNIIVQILSHTCVALFHTRVTAILLLKYQHFSRKWELLTDL